MRTHLEVEVHDLPFLRVIYHVCTFKSSASGYDQSIRRAFRRLRERLTEYGLDSEVLLHVGIPQVVGGELVSYDCRIEFPLPVDDAGKAKSLPEGSYCVLRVEKTSSKIRTAIRAFQGDYLPDHGLVPDEDRPTYDIYFKDVLEYCIPIR